MANKNKNKRYQVNHLYSKDVVKGEAKAPSASDLGESEIALNLANGVETLYVKNGAGEIVATPLGTRAYDAIKNQLEEIAQIYSIYGMARVNGESDPKGTIFFGEKTNFKQIANICHFGYFDQEGKLYKRCANNRVDLATDGTSLKIDGSDGDLLFYIDRTVYVCRFTDVVEGKELNVFALGLAPFTIYGHNAKAFQPFAMDPTAGAYTQLTDSNNGDENKHTVDYRKCIHSIYNPNAKSYRVNDSTKEQYQAAPDIFTKPWRESSNGYPSTYASSVLSVWAAQAKNEVNTINRPYMGMYYEFYEFWLMLMFLELGSVYHVSHTSFGTGTTYMNVANSPEYYGNPDAKGNSGWMRVKVINPTTEDGETTYTRACAGLHSQQTVTESNSYYGHQCLVGTDYYCFTECLEAQRILSDVAKAGLVNKIWDGETPNDEIQKILFTHDENGNMIVCEDVVIQDFATGDSDKINANQKYYQIRNVPGCAGMKDGAMTAVINEYVKMVLKTDGTTNKIYDYIIYKLSYPVYRGMSVFNNFRNHVQGCHYRKWRPEGAGTPVVADFIHALNVDDVPAIPDASTGNNISQHSTDPNYELRLEKGLNGVAKSMNANGWALKADYNGSLFAYTATGGGDKLGECAYNWCSASPTECKYLYAVVVGESAYNVAVASARTVCGCNAVSDAYDSWAPRFALPHAQL